MTLAAQPLKWMDLSVAVDAFLQPAASMVHLDFGEANLTS